MPDLTAPLLSLDASGTIAKTLTYSHWRGIKYARQRVIPNNPNTAAQQAVRKVFANLSTIWLYLPAYATLSNQDSSAGKPLTDRNMFVKNNAANLYAQTDYSLFSPYAAARGGPGGIVNAIVNASTQVTANVTPPATPSGWTLTRVAGLLIRDSDPTLDEPYPTVEHDDATSTYSLVWTGLTNSMTYYGQTAVEWLRPDGFRAWSISTTFTGSPA